MFRCLLPLAVSCCIACTDSHPTDPFGGTGGNPERPSGAENLWATSAGPETDAGTLTATAVDAGPELDAEHAGPLTQVEILHACSSACAYIDQCGGPSLLQCIDGCIKLGGADVTPDCDAEVRALLDCVMGLDCAELDGTKIEIKRTRCAGHLETLREDCALG